METELVIFDMDGTMADTAPGILSSFMTVPSELGIPEPPVEAYYSYTGGPLVDNMARIYSIDRVTAVRAAEIFRKHYESVGFLDAVLYPGIEDLIRSLHGRGVKLGVATMKLDECAKQLMVRWGINSMFTEVVGADSMGTMRKTDMIDRCVYVTGIVPEKTMMVGDTANDYWAAMESGTGFVAVTYGYGFSPEVCAENGIPYAETVGDLEKFLRLEHADVPAEQQILDILDHLVAPVLDDLLLRGQRPLVNTLVAGLRRLVENGANVLEAVQDAFDIQEVHF